MQGQLMDRRNAVKTILTSGITLGLLNTPLVGGAISSKRYFASTLQLKLSDPRFSALQHVNGTVEITNSIIPGFQSVMPSGYPLALVRVDEGTLVALSKECPHNQCQVRTFNGIKFVCPCHGSEFTATGERIAGPTPGPLQSYPVVFDGETVTISGLPGNVNWNLTAAEDIPVNLSFQLLQNEPNPFTQSTQISFQMMTAAFVVLQVFNETGMLVAEIMNDWKEPGFHSLDFDAASLRSGNYFYTMRAGIFVQSKRMVLVR